MEMAEVGRSLVFFLVAGLCEIGGGWLVWQWLRGGQRKSVGALWRACVDRIRRLPTFQSAHFGRVYAAYGGVFIVLSLLWGWGIDGNVPDRFDILGAALSLLGVCIIMYWPR
ncbi:MAG: YnfA family protein [Candidatus Binatia bacterium]